MKEFFLYKLSEEGLDSLLQLSYILDNVIFNFECQNLIFGIIISF